MGYHFIVRQRIWKKIEDRGKGYLVHFRNSHVCGLNIDRFFASRCFRVFIVHHSVWKYNEQRVYNFIFLKNHNVVPRFPTGLGADKCKYIDVQYVFLVFKTLNKTLFLL